MNSQWLRLLLAALAFGCCMVLTATAVNVVYTTALAHRDYYRAAAEQARAATECMRRPPQLIAGPATYVPTTPDDSGTSPDNGGTSPTVSDSPRTVDGDSDWGPIDELRRPESRLIQPKQVFD